MQSVCQCCSPKEPPPPPAPEPAWNTVKSQVAHLTGADFGTFTSARQAVLVMFYVPWCGHCKKAKPAYQAATDKLADNSRALAAVDCTAEGNKGAILAYGRDYPPLSLI